MSQKRVLLIENRPDYGLGGVEKYNAKLVSIIKSNFPEVEIDKCCLLDTFNENKETDDEIFTTRHTKFISKLEKKHKFLFYCLIGFHVFFFRKKVYKLIKKNNYDLIIDSTITYFEKLENKDNFLWIQHVTPKFYKHEYIKNGLMRNAVLFSKHLFLIKNPVMNYKNIVCFDEENAKEISNDRNDKFNLYRINLFNETYNLQQVQQSIPNRKKIIFFGRLENSQKNIKHLIELNKLLGNKIDFYGTGSKKIIDELGDSYKGMIKKEDLFNTISKYKASILLSKYEGFPFSIVQSLSSGLPVITNNTYRSSKFLVNQNRNGILLESEYLDEQAKAIEKFLSMSEQEYAQICMNCYKFAKFNLTERKFENNWINLLYSYLK